MKPFRIFIFGLLALMVIAGISVLVPDQKLDIGFAVIKFPSVYPKASTQPNYKSIKHIISLSKMVSDTFRNNTPNIAPYKSSSDSSISTLPLSTDTSRTVLRKFEFPAANDTLLFHFFSELKSLSDTKQLIRVLHYGDSQIEGDRITSYLRNQLQTRFGGCGIGMIPIVSINPSSLSYVYRVSDNWVRYSLLHESSKDTKYRKFGALLSFARIAQNTGTWSNSKNKDLNGWIELQHSNIGYPLSRRYQQCRIFYGFNASPMLINAKQGDTNLDAEIVPSSASLNELKWTLASPDNLTIYFQTANTPDVYAIALDGLQGVAVDNISLRGSTGLEFTRTNLRFLKEFYQKLNVKLLILQFGANMVHSAITDFSFYSKAFANQIKALKSAIPGITIIVIGINDISQNGENGLETHSNIEKIRDAQRNAALATNCAFWDLYEAMGGRNSMPSWQAADPPLAQKDFVHFSPIGAKIVAEMFYRAFISEYERYTISKALPTQTTP